MTSQLGRVATIAARLRLTRNEVLALRDGDSAPARRVQHFFFAGAQVTPLGAALALHDVLPAADAYWLDHPDTARAAAPVS
jgi:hypothetical protein